MGDHQEFATHLKARLPAIVGDTFNRAAFNNGVVEMLDESESKGKEA